MTKEYLKFDELYEKEKEHFLNETWCDKCGKADLGLKEPVMYIENGKTFIKGKCVVCGKSQISQIIIKQI